MPDTTMQQVQQEPAKEAKGRERPEAIHMMTRVMPSGQQWIPPLLLRYIRDPSLVWASRQQGLHDAIVTDEAAKNPPNHSVEQNAAMADETEHQKKVPDEMKDSPAQVVATPLRSVEQEASTAGDSHHQKKVRDEFRQVKRGTDQLQADHAVDVKVLWTKWKRVIRNFRGKHEWLSPMMMDWLTRRETALARIRHCVDGCWMGNRDGFEKLPNHWPTSGGLYRCRCQKDNATILVCPPATSKSSRGPVKVAPCAQVKSKISVRQLQFGEMRKVTQSLEMLRNKRATLQAWRDLKRIFAPNMGELDLASQMWLIRRCGTLHMAEQCPNLCYFAQDDWSALSRLFRCRCTQEKNDQPQYLSSQVLFTNKRKIVSDSEDSVNSKRCKLACLHSVRKAVDEMEAHGDSTTEQLCISWKHLSQRFWRMPGLEDHHDDYTWVYRRRLAAVNVAYCTEFCWEKDRKAFFAHSGRILPDEKYRCTCPPTSLPPETERLP